MTTSPKRTLAQIAADMRAQLALENGYVPCRLGGGLELVLSRSDDHWQLVAKRTDVAPSDVEIATLRRAFGVPEEPHVRPFARRMLTPKTREMALYRGIELSWREV
jgi:hypothetical protein